MRERFEVSTKGMAALQSGREPWQLVKELVSNCFDEKITMCTVTLKSTDTRRAILTVYDDGEGFVNIRDAWTLMGDTNKRRNPNVRGRFNIGEKEILSVAKSASIKTSGHIIIFPEQGGRLLRKIGGVLKGTLIECRLTWGVRQVEETITKLKTLIPPKDIVYTVNDETVPYVKPFLVVEANLDTVLENDGALHNIRRDTEVWLYETKEPWLYELGIPVQPIACQFSVNVQQKVPLPPNRDVVRDSYLKTLYAVVLTAAPKQVEDVSATWVRSAIESGKTDDAVVKDVVQRRYGDKVVLWSTDKQANERAMEHGYEVIHGNTLSREERKVFEDVAELKHSSDVFPSTYGDAKVYTEDELTEGMRSIRAYAMRLHHELIGHPLQVGFYSQPDGAAGADYVPCTLRFNVGTLHKSWFERVGPAQTGLILHEFSHFKVHEHILDFNRALQEMAGKAVHLALEKPVLFKM